MVLDQEWQLKPEDDLSLVDELMEEKHFLHKNRWLGLRV